MGFGSGEGFSPGRNNLVGDFTVEGNISASAALSGAFFFGDGSFLQNVTGSSGAANSIKVGNDVDSGTANRVLYENASNDLAESANLTFDGTSLAVGASSPSTISASSNITGSTLKLEHGLTASSVFIGGPMGTVVAESGSALYVSGGLTASSGVCIHGTAPRVALQLSSALETHTALQFWKGSRNQFGKWVNFYARGWSEPSVRVGNADGRVELKLPHIDLPGPSVGSDNTLGDRGFLFHNAQTSSYASFHVACTTSVDYIDFGFTDRESSTPAIRILGNGKITVDCGNVDTAGTYAGTSSPAAADNQFLLQSSQINFGTASNCIVNVTGGIRVTPGAGSHDPIAGYVSASTGITGSSLQISDGSRHYGMTNEGNLGVATVTGSGLVSNIEMPYITASMGVLIKRNADNADRAPLVAISGASGTDGLNSNVQSALWVSGSGNDSGHPVVKILTDGFYPLSIESANNHCAFMMRAGQGLDAGGNRVPSTELNLNGKFLPPADLSSDGTRTWSWGVDCGTADYRRFRIINGQSLGITASSDLGFCATGSVEAGGRYGETFWGFNLNNPAHTLDINGGLCVTGSTILGANATSSVSVIGTLTGSGLVSNIEMPYITASMGALFKRNADNADRSPLVAISGASGEGVHGQNQASLWVSGSGDNSARGVVHVESHGPYTISLLTRNDNTNIIYRAGQGLDGSGERQPKSETNIAFKMAPPADIGGGSADLSRTWALGVDCQEADYRRFRITNKSGVDITASSDYGFVGTGSLWGFNLNNPAHTLDINGGLCVTGSTILGTDATGSVNVVGNFFVNQATEATLADNADALTIAQMLGRLAKITPTTDRSKATPTAAQIVAGITLPTVDQAWDFTVINLAAGGSGNKLTLTAGDGAVTLVGSMELNDASSATFRVRLTNVDTEAVTIYRIS